MPGPATAEELLQLVERSQVADRAVIEKARASWREKKSDDESPAAFAQHLMDLGVITPFHAEQLLAGRYKGFRVGAYRILRLIGVGGMGRVYLAEHAFMKRRVALKILPKSQHKESSAIERFQREAQAVAALNHPNIVHAYDSGQEGDVYFLAMEYVAGESVQDYVKQYGRVPWPYAADFIRQAALGLQHAADSGLVHRDIKPGNLLVDLTGTVKLLDLGLAMFFTEQVDGDPLTLRYNESVLGTADYLAPEQAVDSHNIDIRADIYSLGGTLYYLLSGQAPFPAGTIAQKLLWHQQKDPESITSIVADVPKSLEAVLRRMMAKKPDQRFATAADTAAALLPFSKPHPQPFPSSAAKQYETTAVRPHSRPFVPPSQTGNKAQRPPTSIRAPAGSAGTAPGASSKRISPVAMATPPAPTASPQKMDPAIVDTDVGLDFLRVSTGKPPTDRNLSSAETMTARKVPTTLSTNRTSSAIWIGAGAAALALIGTLVVISLWKRPGSVASYSTNTIFVPKKPSTEKKTAVGPGPGISVVKTGLGHKGPGSLIEALETLGPRWTIVLGAKSSGEWDLEPIVLGEGRLQRSEEVHVVGERPDVVVSTQTMERPLLRIKRVKGFVLKDLIIDGNGRSTPLLTIESDGADCRIENVVFRNFKGDAIHLVGARGQKDRPVVVKDCRFHGAGDTARGIVVVPSVEDPSPVRNVLVEGNRFFSCASGLCIQGPLATATARNNIFAAGGIGIQFAPGAGSALLEEFRIESCTFWRVAAGVALDDPPTGLGKIVVSDCLFVEVQSPPVVATPAVAEHLKTAKSALETSGLWADQAAPKTPANRAAVGLPPSIGVVDFMEIDAMKPGFLQPKRPIGDGKSPPSKPIGAVAPAGA